MELASDTTNLFRPNQVEEAKEELRRMDSILNAPPHIRGKVSDPRAMGQRRKRLAGDLEKYEPKAFRAEEKDAAVTEFAALAESIKAGMPSSEEMRRNSPGCVNKHLGWEKRNKTDISRWKHIGLRLAAGGDVRGDIAQSADVINIEILRERATNRDLSMEGAQIPKTVDIHFGADPVNAVVFSDDEMERLTALSPSLAGQLSILDNPARAELKAILAKAAAPAAGSPAATNAKPTMKELGYNGMKKLAAANGVNCKGIKQADLIAALRARHLID